MKSRPNDPARALPRCAVDSGRRPSSVAARPVALLVALLATLLLASCGTVEEWREFQSGPATRAEVYDAVEFLARSDGFSPSVGECDRGLATWASRWRYRNIGLGRPGRFRLKAEIDLDRHRDEDVGWTVRYLIEQQKVKDLRRSMDPREEDWSDDGQDVEREYLFGERLRRRLGGTVLDQTIEPGGRPGPGVSEPPGSGR